MMSKSGPFAVYLSIRREGISIAVAMFSAVAVAAPALPMVLSPSTLPVAVAVAYG